MDANNSDFKKIFLRLQSCQKQIHAILPEKGERENDLPIQKLHESFALCAGAFYHQNLYHKEYDDLFDNSKNINPHEESWKFFGEDSNLSEFNTLTKHSSDLIKPEFRSMCIANAAFRLPSAGFLISDLVNQFKNSKKYCGIANDLKASWKYHNCLNKYEDDWGRFNLKIKDCDSKNLADLLNKPYFFLALLVCMRDEYGHSEYHEHYKCRHQVVKKYYCDHIVNAEIIFMQETIDMIIQLCQYHPQIDLCKKISS